MPVHPRIAERYARAVAAALAAVACLLLAANAGPTDSARPSVPAPVHDVAPPADDLASSGG
ncbi:hypothetical protein [Streptomyces sp. enrichment culture]|uniref:hypothetical protein n=1 Tax=Streptomyces sp. enrichment culture TaxID=1795815 RepID=UPI003F572FA9